MKNTSSRNRSPEAGHEDFPYEDILSLPHPEVTLTYFRPDEKKDGGAYVEKRGKLKKIDHAGQCLVLESGEKIPMHRLVDL